MTFESLVTAPRGWVQSQPMATTLTTIGRGEPVRYSDHQLQEKMKSYDLVPELGLASSGGERPRFSLPSAPSSFPRIHPPSSTRSWMREYTTTPKGKNKWSLLFLSVPAGPHPLLTVPDHENTACRRVAPVAPKIQLSLPHLGCPTHSPLSRAVQRQSGGNSWVRNTSRTSNNTTSIPSTTSPLSLAASLLQHHQQRHHQHHRPKFPPLSITSRSQVLQQPSNSTRPPPKKKCAIIGQQHLPPP
ncbi:hypothetical protein QBC39DRAFT_346883 [Podospora conica]|nr:hypothetical protein QBC39DRAFT_346883 [Schizothecium conicum]